MIRMGRAQRLLATKAIDVNAADASRSMRAGVE